MQIRPHSFGVFLLVALFGAFVSAFVFIAVIQLTLPSNDEAYGQSVLRTLADPFVTGIATPVALLAGVLATPLLYFSLRRRRLAVALPIVFGTVLVAVVIATPIDQLLGLFSSFAALVISSIVCSRIRATSYGDSHENA